MVIYYIEQIERCLKMLLDSELSWLKDAELHDDFINAISILEALESCSQIHYLSQLQLHFDERVQIWSIRFGPNGLILCFKMVTDGIVITFIGKQNKNTIEYGCGEYNHNESCSPRSIASRRAKNSQDYAERICNI